MTSTDTERVADVTPHGSRGALSRIVNVARLHVANPVPMFVIPVAITFVIFGVNLAIWAMVASAAGGRSNLEADAFSYNGGVTWIIVFMMVIGVQAVTLTFRFALGFSVTRRDYFAGTLLFFAGMSAVYAVFLATMAALERATDGWGLGGGFFGPWGLADAPIAVVWLVFFAAMLLSFAIGFVVAGIWMRWRAYGLYTFFIVLATLGVAAGWWMTSQSLWGDLFSWLGEQSLTSMSLWSLAATVVCAGLGWGILRHATPRS
ncbi:hypothetical protein [Demequina flava]|uniref:hypothetical protein n=1 Tax=Demequina flava TaxID=1095025 RepID=UPI0007816648|nr:hypothetical protein [Demequina flava]